MSKLTLAFIAFFIIIALITRFSWLPLTAAPLPGPANIEALSRVWLSWLCVIFLAWLLIRGDKLSAQ